MVLLPIPHNELPLKLRPKLMFMQQHLRTQDSYLRNPKSLLKKKIKKCKKKNRQFPLMSLKKRSKQCPSFGLFIPQVEKKVF